MPAKLHAVADGERATPDKPITSVLAAAEHGTRLDELKQMRRVIARALDNPNTSPRDLAALSRRQIEISKEVESIQAQAKEEAREHGVTSDEQFDPQAI